MLYESVQIQLGHFQIHSKKEQLDNTASLIKIQVLVSHEQHQVLAVLSNSTTYG